MKLFMFYYTSPLKKMIKYSENRKNSIVQPNRGMAEKFNFNIQDWICLGINSEKKKLTLKLNDEDKSMSIIEIFNRRSEVKFIQIKKSKTQNYICATIYFVQNKLSPHRCACHHCYYKEKYNLLDSASQDFESSEFS